MTNDRIEELKAAARHHTARVPAVSRWSVGMHVHHCCLAMIGICRDDAMTFLRIHDAHHLRIIAEILKASRFAR